jgi:hypothetical protein
VTHVLVFGSAACGAAALLESPVTARLVRLGVSGNLSAEMFARVRERFG